MPSASLWVRACFHTPFQLIERDHYIGLIMGIESDVQICKEVQVMLDPVLQNTSMVRSIHSTIVCECDILVLENNI